MKIINGFWYAVYAVKFTYLLIRHPRQTVNEYFGFVIPVYAVIGAVCILTLSLNVYWNGINQFLKSKYERTIIIENRQPERISEPSGSGNHEGQADTVQTVRETGAATVQDQIRDIAQQEGFEEIDKLVKLAKCESSLNPKAVNYNSDIVKSVDRGVFQWNNYWHPEITDECAYDVNCATKAAVKHISKKGFGAWVCNKYI